MKLSKHAWLIWGIALAAVLALAFIIPFTRSATFYLALAAMLAMFGICAGAFVRAFRTGNSLESKLLGWPIFKVGYTALAGQILIGFVLMALAALCPVWVAAIAEVLVFAAAGMSLTVKDAARVVVARSEARAADNTQAWKAIRAKAANLAAVNPKLARLAEEIRYADPTPCSMDAQIDGALDALRENASDEKIENALRLVQERNRIAKSSK